MKLPGLLMASLLMSQFASASLEKIQQVSQEQLAGFDALPAGVNVSVTGDRENPVLHIVSEGREPAELRLATIKQPAVNTAFYAIRGEISYADVASDGYLEMYVWFDEATSFFSRSQAEHGPMGKLAHHSDWRGFCLPFNSATIPASPTRLVLNIKLPGRGNVTVRNLRLEQAASMEELLGGPSPSASAGVHDAPGVQLTDAHAGVIGGIAGAVIGCLGSLLEFLASRGRARGFVIGTAWVLSGLGAACLGAGVMAWATAQAPAVSQFLLLAGVLCVVIFPVRLRRYQQHYQQTELRRIDSLDAVST